MFSDAEQSEEGDETFGEETGVCDNVEIEGRSETAEVGELKGMLGLCLLE